MLQQLPDVPPPDSVDREDLGAVLNMMRSVNFEMKKVEVSSNPLEKHLLVTSKLDPNKVLQGVVQQQPQQVQPPQNNQQYIQRQPVEAQQFEVATIQEATPPPPVVDNQLELGFMKTYNQPPPTYKTLADLAKYMETRYNDIELEMSKIKAILMDIKNQTKKRPYRTDKPSDVK